MTKGRKLFIPKCEYFTTGGYMYLFNCPYKTEHLKSENDNLSVELKVAQRDIDNLTRTLEKANDEIKALEAENAALQARLENAVELPFIIHVSNNYAVIVYVDENGKIHKTHTYATKEAEARLAEIKGGRE